MLIRFIALRLVVYAGVAYVTTGVFLAIIQSRLIFPAPEAETSLTPASNGLRFEDLQIPVNATDHLHAWWIPAEKRSLNTVLMFHGNAEVLADTDEEQLRTLHDLGASILAIDYRGYGSSTRVTPNETTIDADARAALAELTRGRKIPIGNVIVIGRSIGTGPATQLSCENAQLGGLILVSPFSNIEDVADRAWYLRIFPVHLLLRTHFDNAAKLSSVRAPLLIVSGTADTLTPVAMAKKLFAEAHEPKQIYLVPGAGHNDLGREGQTAIASWIGHLSLNQWKPKASR